MTKEEILKGIEEMGTYAPVSGIEKELGMPLTTIQKVLKDNRQLPVKWVKPLKKYFLKNRDKDLDAEDKADEKMKEELANAPEMTKIMEEIVELKVGDKKVWNKAFEDARTYGGKKKKNVNLKNLTTPSKGKTKDLNEKETTNYPINTTGKGVKKESDYLASRRKLKS